MAKDPFGDKNTSISDPIRSATTVTPDDSNDLNAVTRAIYVGIEGDVTCILADDNTSVLLKGAIGIIPIQVKRILATGTTATYIITLN